MRREHPLLNMHYSGLYEGYENLTFDLKVVNLVPIVVHLHYTLVRQILTVLYTANYVKPIDHYAHYFWFNINSQTVTI